MANPAVMVLDLSEKVRDSFSLYYLRDKYRTPWFDDLTKFLDYSHMNDLPVIIIRPIRGFSEHLAEVEKHPVFRRARIIEKPKADAFSNPEVESHLRELGVQDIILAGYSFYECIPATAKGARKKGYSVVTAKTILYIHEKDVVSMRGRDLFYRAYDTVERRSTEIIFRKLYDNIDALVNDLVLCQ